MLCGATLGGAHAQPRCRPSVTRQGVRALWGNRGALPSMSIPPLLPPSLSMIRSPAGASETALSPPDALSPCMLPGSLLPPALPLLHQVAQPPHVRQQTCTAPHDGAGSTAPSTQLSAIPQASQLDLLTHYNSIGETGVPPTHRDIVSAPATDSSTCVVPTARSQRGGGKIAAGGGRGDRTSRSSARTQDDKPVCRALLQVQGSDARYPLWRATNGRRLTRRSHAATVGL